MLNFPEQKVRAKRWGNNVVKEEKSGKIEKHARKIKENLECEKSATRNTKITQLN